MIGRGEDWKAHRGSRDALSLVAFYADCQHEVLKVQSGYRITLTYNLMLRGGPTLGLKGDAGTVAELAGLLREHFAAPATTSWGGLRADPPCRLVYLLDHEYTPRALNWTRMKGADARRVPLLRDAAEAAGYEAILGLADVKTTHDAWPDEGDGYRRRRYYDDDADPEDSAEYEINDLINTEVSLTHWTGPDSGRLEETSLSVDDTEVCASTRPGTWSRMSPTTRATWGTGATPWTAGTTAARSSCGPGRRRSRTARRPHRAGPSTRSCPWRRRGTRTAPGKPRPRWNRPGAAWTAEAAPAPRQGTPRGGRRGGFEGRCHAA